MIVRVLELQDARFSMVSTNQSFMPSMHLSLKVDGVWHLVQQEISPESMMDAIAMGLDPEETILSYLSKHDAVVAELMATDAQQLHDLVCEARKLTYK